MVEKVISSDGFSEVPFGELGKSEAIGGGWMLRQGKVTKRGGLFASKVSSQSGTGLQIRTPERVDWIRLERKIDNRDLASGYVRISARFAASSPSLGSGEPIGVIGIYKYKDGSGAPYIVSKDTPKTSPNLSCISNALEVCGFEDDVEYRLSLSIRNPVDILVYSLDMEEISISDYRSEVADKEISSKILNASKGGEVAPFRVQKSPVNDKLRVLNDEMDKRLKSNPSEWLREMLQVSLRLEDYETAKSLASHIIEISRSPSEDISKSLPLIVDTYVALGDKKALKDLCLELVGNETGIEYLSSIYHLIEEFPQNTVCSKKGLYQTNVQLGSKASSANLIDVVSVMSGEGQDNLIAANYFRRDDADKYTELTAKYFESFNLPYIPIMKPSGENVLENTLFKTSSTRGGDLEVTEGKHQPLVSVIISAYNCESTLEYAINSILSQRYKNIEILIADDASADGTLNILAKFSQNPKVRVFSSKSNQGPYNIRNSLIPRSRGEYITFHDSDDLALPHRIDMQVNRMLSDSTLVSLSRWIRVRPDGHFVAFRDNIFLRMCVNSIMFHRRVFDHFGPYRSTLFGADSEFYEKVKGTLGQGKVSQINAPSVLGLWSDSSLTRTSGIEANETGYRSEKRRCYAALANRQRILGSSLVPDSFIDTKLRQENILRDSYDVEELSYSITP